MPKFWRYITLLGIGALSLPALFVLTSVKEVNGYSHQTSLPTTIDLNASTESEIRSYYKDLRNLTPSEAQGNNLLKRLKTILKTNQIYYSYDSNGENIWKMYEITDRDWDLSPASSTKYGTYNSSTNKITNYQYGTSASNSKNNPYIHALYINRDVTNQTTAWDDHQQTEWGINREHVWAKAEGFDTTGDNSDTTSGGARGDPMHLMAGNGYSNNIHSNYFFGYVNQSKIDTDCGKKYSNQKGNMRGSSLTLGGDTSVFEPQDSDKGDIARAIFYMVARYNYLSGSDTDNINGNNPNLTLSQSLSDWKKSGYTSSASQKGYMGIMTDLLNWHHSDPVDDYEIRRNNILYKNYTNNRNPFIDFPEWVDYIWGTATYNGTTYVSYSSNPTGSADPDSDTINGYNSGSAVAVTGVTLNPSTSEVEVNKSVTLTASVSPSNATDKSVTWTSSDTSIATVSNGVVSGISEGNVTITVTTNDGHFSASSTITIIPESADPTPTGDISFSRSSSTDTVTSGYELVNTSAKAYSEYYTDKSGSEGLNLGIKKSSGNIWTTSPNKIALKVKVGGGSTRTLTNNLIAHFIDSNGDIISSSETLVTDKVETTTGQEYTVLMPATNNVAGVMLHHTKEESYNIRVYSITLSIIKELENITLDTDNVQKEFLTTDTFNYDDLGVTANYSDETSAVVIPTNVSTPDLSTVGTKTVTVSYTEGDVTKEATYEITVSAPTVTLSSISVSNPTTSFDVGDEFVFGGTVTAHYSDSSTKDVTSSSNFIGYDAYTSGTQTITVSYSEDGVTKEEEYSITVNKIEGSTTVRTSIGTYASAHNWVNGTSYESVELDGVITATKVGTGNNGRYYTSGKDWRFYQNGSGAITISAAENYLIDKITITFTDSNTGILIDENDEPLSPSIAENINANSATFTVSNSGSATNGIIKITEFIVIYHYVAPAPMTSISASVSKDYHPGDVITRSDITVTGDNGEIVTGFSFANDNYQFTYQDAPSGGQVLAKTFTNSITYLTFTCSLTVNVSRNNYAQPASVTYSLTTDDFANLNGTSKAPVTNTITKNGVDFKMTESYKYSNFLSLKTSGNQTDKYMTNGIIYNDNAFSSHILTVKFTFDSGGTPSVYPNVYYKNNSSDWSLTNDGTATFFMIKFDERFIGYINFDSITVTTKGAETALNVANYIMYEDTNNQCKTKFDIAANYFNDMSISERNTFMTSNDYVILNARERFNAWARHLGKQVSFENNDYVIKEAIQSIPLINKVSSNNMIAVVIVSSLLGLSTIAGYFYIRKKKED